MMPASLPPMTKTHEIHPAALLFPMMSDDELAKLADDIAANGLLEPIIIFQGQLLDGRNRLKACEIADVEPNFIEAPESSVPSAALYVLSRNLHRRHLTISQRAAIAADVVPMLEQEARKREVAGRKPDPTANMQQGSAAAIAGKSVGASERTVYDALSVKRSAPEKFEQIRNGEITVHAATHDSTGKRISPATTDANEPYEPTTKRKTQVAETQKERMVRALSQITGLCRGLSAMDVRKALSVCDTEERAMWTERAKELASQLRAFAARLEKGK